MSSLHHALKLYTQIFTKDNHPSLRSKHWLRHRFNSATRMIPKIYCFRQRIPSREPKKKKRKTLPFYNILKYDKTRNWQLSLFSSYLPHLNFTPDLLAPCLMNRSSFLAIHKTCRSTPCTDSESSCYWIPSFCLWGKHLQSSDLTWWWQMQDGRLCSLRKQTLKSFLFWD